MTDQEVQSIAKATAAELRKECQGCPLGVTHEQADALKVIADGYILSKKTIWKTVINAMVYSIIGMIGYGIIYKIGEIAGKLNK